MGLKINEESDRGYPKTQTAIICGPNGEFNIEHEVPTIDLEPENVIIRTLVSPLNPLDTKMLGGFCVPGNIHGVDAAGVIVAMGPKVTRDLKIGDRVAGSADIMYKERPLGGGFAEYVSLHSNLVLKVPESMSIEHASALGTPIASTVVALFHTLGLPTELLHKPLETPEPFLVYGGSTASGTMIIQFLKVCGYHVITTCSPRNFDLVKSYGADEVYDYNDPDCASQIKKSTRNCLAFAVDCITASSSMKICYDSIGRVGGKYVALDPFPESGATRKVVKPDWILATILWGHEILWPAPFARPGQPYLLEEFAPPLYLRIQELVDEGCLRPHPVTILDTGFEGIVDGVNKIRRGEVSGTKLIYRL